MNLIRKEVITSLPVSLAFLFSITAAYAQTVQAFTLQNLVWWGRDNTHSAEHDTIHIHSHTCIHDLYSQHITTYESNLSYKILCRPVDTLQRSTLNTGTYWGKIIAFLSVTDL